MIFSFRPKFREHLVQKKILEVQPIQAPVEGVMVEVEDISSIQLKTKRIYLCILIFKFYSFNHIGNDNNWWSSFHV